MADAWSSCGDRSGVGWLVLVSGWRRLVSLCRHSAASGSSIHSMMDPWWRRRTSRTSPEVDEVDAAVGEVVVQAGFQADGVVAEDEGVDVVAERDAGVAEFADPVVGVQSAGHADLDHVLPEGADVGDHVHVPGPDVGCAAAEAVDGVLDLGELGLGLVGGFGISLGAQCGGRGVVVGEFLAEPFLLALVLAQGDLLLAEPTPASCRISVPRVSTSWASSSLCSARRAPAWAVRRSASATAVTRDVRRDSSCARADWTVSICRRCSVSRPTSSLRPSTAARSL
jgi:hypothetical protein